MFAKQSAVFVPFQKKGIISTDGLTSTLAITSTVRDRLAGMTITEEIWNGVSVNSAYISRLLANKERRDRLEEFFATRLLRKIIKDLIGTQSVRLGGFLATVPEALQVISKHAGNDIAGVVLEIVGPGLVRNHLLVPPTERGKGIMNRFTMPMRQSPSIDDLATEYSRVELERAINDCAQGLTLESGRTYAASALADTIAESYFTIALRLRAAYEYDIVLEDVLKGIIVSFDPVSDGLHGDVPAWLYGHDVVRTLATNWTFFSAAVKLRAEIAESNGSLTLAPQCDQYKFDNLAPAILALLKTSDRYVLRSRSDIMHEHSLSHVVDVRGTRRAAILTEHAKMDPVALAIVAYDDPMMSGAINVARSVGRIDAHIAAAYGKVADTMTPMAAGQLLGDLLRHCFEAERYDEEQPHIEGVYMNTVCELDIVDAALMLSDSIMFDPSNPTDVVYCLRTNASFPDGLKSGMVMRGSVYTTDPAEVLLAADEFAAKSVREALPQLLPRAALGAALFSEEGGTTLVNAVQRYTFDRKIGRCTVRGALRWAELEIVRADAHATLVRPVYNAAVFETTSRLMDVCHELAKSAPAEIRRTCQRSVAHATIDMARGVSDAFRKQVHGFIITRSLSGLSQPEIGITTAQLNGQAVAGFADLYATAFFFAIQGLGNSIIDRETDEVVELTVPGVESAIKARATTGLPSVFTRVWSDDEYAQVMAERGSERK